MTRTYTRICGVLLTLVCLGQQWGAVCPCPVPEACADSCPESTHECGDAHDDPAPPTDRSHDHGPLHLCSAAHAYYLVTTAVEVAGSDLAPRWISTNGSATDARAVAGSGSSHRLETSFDPYLSAGLRAQREILRI